MKPVVLIAAIAFLAAQAQAHAIDIQTIDVRYQDGLYRVQFVAELAATPDAVGRVLKDYAKYPALDARIEESHLIASPAGAPAGAPARLYTRLKGCLNRLMCRSMVRIEILQERPGDLIATAIPELSDVKKSVTHTQWQGSPKGTRVSYSLTLDPKFWVPAFFGRRAMIDTMRDGTVNMFTSVERVARRLPTADAQR
jgi:hypothetical protein